MRGGGRGGRCSVFLMMRFLGDVLKNTLTSMFLTMYEKICNIVLMMHISDVFVDNFKRIEKLQ